MRKAFAYLRVSSAGQVERDGFARQRLAIETYARTHAIEIVRWFEEKGVSGTKELTDRPQLSALMVALLSDGVNLVLIEKLDRLARDQMVQEGIIQSLLKNGFELISATPGEENLCGNDPGRKLMRTIMGAIAEYDKQMIVLKLRAARQRRKARDGRCEGRKPFGQTDEERATIARMKALRSEGLPLATIAVRLNKERLRPQTAKRWYASSVLAILKRTEQEQ